MKKKEGQYKVQLESNETDILFFRLAKLMENLLTSVDTEDMKK